jgi:hypothetical protein
MKIEHSNPQNCPLPSGPRGTEFRVIEGVYPYGGPEPAREALDQSARRGNFGQETQVAGSEQDTEMGGFSQETQTIMLYFAGNSTLTPLPGYQFSGENNSTTQLKFLLKTAATILLPCEEFKPRVNITTVLYYRWEFSSRAQSTTTWVQFNFG